MSELPNGIRERVRVNSDQIEKLWTNKASKESVVSLTKEFDGLRKDMKEEVSGLRRVLLGVAGAWVFGTIMFLIAALEFAH